MATVLPFHRVVLDDPAFTAENGVFDVHTRWIETEFVNTIEMFPTPVAVETPAPAGPLREFVAEVNGRRVRVGLPAELVTAGAARPTASPGRSRRSKVAHAVPLPTKGAVVAPMQGTVVKVAVAVDDAVRAGDVIAVIEAMKMENPITAHHDGKITAVKVEVGGKVTAGAVVAEIAEIETEPIPEETVIDVE
jgi:acetyl-CoA/propionyl-CoA carboxylase biotin carboxyl carrier protein